MKKRLIVIMTCLCMVFVFTACSDSGESTDTADTEATTEEVTTEADESDEAEDMIKSIELFGEEEGVAYWDVYLSDDCEWSSMQFYDQAEVALEAIVKCVEDDQTPDADHCWVDGYQDEAQTMAFAWSIDQSDKIVLYDENGAIDTEYLLEKADIERINNAKK